MKLSRNLFLILVLLFIIGVVLVSVVNPASVMSRIATGLITGSFVGAISAFVNYAHLRTVFFNNLVISLWDFFDQLKHDYILAKVRNEQLAESSKEENIAYYKGRTKETFGKVADMEQRYGKINHKIDIESFSGFALIDRLIENHLDKVDRFVSTEAKRLCCEYNFCLGFSLLSVEVTKEEQELVIGDPDDFYNSLLKANKQFQSILASDIDRLGKLCEDLCKNPRWTISSENRRTLSIIKSLTDSFLKDVEIYDVRQETEDES